MSPHVILQRFARTWQNMTCLGPLARRGPEQVCVCTADQTEADISFQDQAQVQSGHPAQQQQLTGHSRHTRYWF